MNNERQVTREKEGTEGHVRERCTEEYGREPGLRGVQEMMRSAYPRDSHSSRSSPTFHCVLGF